MRIRLFTTRDKNKSTAGILGSGKPRSSSKGPWLYLTCYLTARLIKSYGACISRREAIPVVEHTPQTTVGRGEWRYGPASIPSKLGRGFELAVKVAAHADICLICTGSPSQQMLKLARWKMQIFRQDHNIPKPRYYRVTPPLPVPNQAEYTSLFSSAGVLSGLHYGDGSCDRSVSR